MGRAQAKALRFHLTSTAASKRQKGRIATDPLLTTRRLHYRRLGITTKATMLALNRLGFHAVGSHGVSLFDTMGLSPSSGELEPCLTHAIVL